MDLNYGGISLEAYQQTSSGFGSASSSDVQELNKALEAGESSGLQTLDQTDLSGAPLKVESLEKNLKVVTFTQKNIVLWKDTPVLPAYNNVEQYLRLTSYGSNDGGFIEEGELPAEDDSTYVRKAELVKFIGNTRVISHPMTLINTAGDNVVQREIRNGTIFITSILENKLVHGNADLNSSEFNGLFKQQSTDYTTELDYLNSDNVIDLRGYRPTEKNLEEASNVIIENYGFATDIYWSPRAGSEFARNMYPRQRMITPVNGNNVVGSQITGFLSQAGEVGLHPDVFLRPKSPKKLTTVASSVKAPAAPIAGTTGVAPVAATVTDSRWDSSTAGNYFYAVTAFNRHGESALTLLKSTVSAIVSGGAADLTFTAGVGNYAATGYRIYVSSKNVTASTGYFYPIFEVSVTNLASGYNGASAGSIRDLNIFLPGTSQGFMLQRDLEVFCFKQLAPLMKMNLALLSPAFRFMILLYGTPILFAPRKMVRFINIGSTEDATTNALIA